MLIILFWNTIFLVWIIAVGFIFPLQIVREDGWRFMNMDDTPPSPLSYIAVLKLCERPSLWRELRKLLKVDQSGCRLMNEIPPTPLPLPRHHFPRLLFPNCARGRLSTMTGVTSRLQRWFEESNFPDELSKSKFVWQGSSPNSYFKWIWNVENLIRLWFWWWRFLVLVSSSLL